MNKKITLSIIIVNYNGCKFLIECLKSIEFAMQSIDFEIIIVDNNSTDGSIELIQNYYPNIILVSNSINLGFAKANNQGVKLSSGEYILLLNNDTIINEDILPALNIFETTKTIGALSIRMIGEHGEYRLSAGYFPNIIRLLKFSLLYKKNLGFKNGNIKPGVYEVDWIEGSFLMTKRSIWNQLNGLDENIFMYCEDLDFCKRLKNAGLSTVYYSHISYTHFGGYNISRENQLYNGFRYYNSKHMPLVQRKFSNVALCINKKIKSLIRHVNKSYTKNT